MPFWAPDQKWPKGLCGQVNQRQCPDPSEIRQSSWRIRMVPVSRSGTGEVLGKQGNREDTVTEPYRRWQWVPAWQTSVDGASRTPGGWRDPCASAVTVLDTQEPRRRLEPGWKSCRPSAGPSAGGVEDSSKLESFLRKKQEAEEAESLVSLRLKSYQCLKGTFKPRNTLTVIHCPWTSSNSPSPHFLVKQGW